MIVRALDIDGDWTYGSGKNNYKTGNNAVAQEIQTRILSFLGDCFFDLNTGIDWFNLLGNKDQTALNLAISATILNTPDVLGLLELYVNLSSTRNFTISYKVETIYSIYSSQLVYNLNGYF